MIEILQSIVGAVVVLFVPGFSLSWAFFPKKDEIDYIERLALSFGLSIAVVPLAVFYANRFLGVPITLISSVLIIAAISAVGLAVYYHRIGKITLPYVSRFEKKGKKK